MKNDKSGILNYLQVPAILIIFIVQLWIMTSSIHAFMDGDRSNLWIACMVSIGLTIPALVLAFVGKSPTEFTTK